MGVEIRPFFMELSINGIKWYVVMVKPYSAYMKREDGTYTIGMTDGVTHCIYLSDILRGDILKKVLTHEIVHAISFSYGCNFDEMTEEIIADFVATYGREVIDNADKLIYNGLHNIFYVV